jgi:hypothetical protein
LTHQRQNAPQRAVDNGLNPLEKRRRARRPGESNREASRLGDVGS